MKSIIILAEAKYLAIYRNLISHSMQFNLPNAESNSRDQTMSRGCHPGFLHIRTKSLA